MENQRMDILPPRLRVPGQYSWLGHINWGHGMMGKATVAVVALIVLLSVVAWRVRSEYALLLTGGIGCIVVIGYFLFLMYIAHYHPVLAATEGPTYVQSRRMELAAKKLPKPLDAETVADPQNPTLFSGGSS
jgi:hypothetical protein